jgi:hypothetical protein
MSGPAPALRGTNEPVLPPKPPRGRARGKPPASQDRISAMDKKTLVQLVAAVTLSAAVLAAATWVVTSAPLPVPEAPAMR